MFEDILLGLVHQFIAGVNLSEAMNTETVGLVHVLVQERTAGVRYGQDIQEVVLGDGELPRVGIVDQARDHGRLDVVCLGFVIGF